MREKKDKEKKEEKKEEQASQRRTSFTISALILGYQQALMGKVACLSSLKGDVIFINRKKYDKLCEQVANKGEKG